MAREFMEGTVLVDRVVMALQDRLTAPLAVWRRPLTAPERATEREHELAAAAACAYGPSWVYEYLGHAALEAERTANPHDRDLWLPTAWKPLLPQRIPRCRHTRLCAGCRRVRDIFGSVVESLSLLCFADNHLEPEASIWRLKNSGASSDGREWSQRMIIAAALSAFLEIEQQRLSSRETLVTAVPSRAPIVANALELAGEQGWFTLPVEPAGAKRGDWCQHESSYEQRLARRPTDWLVDTAVVRGRDVLLLDDVWVTGVSATSYSAALQRAGAKRVNVLCVAQHTGPRHQDYADALRIIRRQRPWVWRIDSTVECQPAAPRS